MFLHRVTLPVAFLAAILISTPSRAADSNLTGFVELGITPEAVVVSDLTAHLPGMLARMEAAVQLRTLLETHRSSVIAASSEVTDISSELWADPLNSTLLAQYSAAASQLAEAQQQLEQTRVALLQEIMLGVPSQALTNLQTWRTSEKRPVAPAFRVQERAVEQWTAIERALVAERRAQRLGTELAAAHAQILAQVRAEPEVMQAELRLQTYLPAVQQLFAQHAPPTAG